jgi:hypothetical protein
MLMPAVKTKREQGHTGTTSFFYLSLRVVAVGWVKAAVLFASLLFCISRRVL